MSEKIIAHFKMTRAVDDDAETAALAAASEHLHQLDSLRLECGELTAENARLSLENAQLRKGFTAASEIARVADAERAAWALSNAQAEAEVRKLRDECAALTEQLAAASSPTSAIELFKTTQRLRSERDNAVAELAHMRDQLGFALATIEKATTEAADAVVYANVDTSLSDPRPGKLLVVRIAGEDANSLALQSQTVTFWRSQFVGWLEAAQDEGDTETKAVDVHHAGMPTPVVRCGECTSVNGHFGDCAKAVTP